MAISAVSVRDFVANGNEDDIEGAPSHPIDQGKFSDSDQLWFRKTMECERIARLEVLAQEFFRLLMPNQPETRLGEDESTGLSYVLSQAVPRFHSLPRNQKQKFTNGAYRGLGLILIIAIFLQEIDLRNTNLGLNDNNEVIKIDGDWCFAALRDPSAWADQPRDISPELIDSLPYPMGIHTYHWIGLVKNSLAQVDSEYVNPAELSHTPHFRAEINQAILQILLTPEDYLTAFVETFIEEEAYLHLDFMLARTLQLKESALHNESFREYLASEQALIDAEAHLQRIKCFETHGNTPIISQDCHSTIGTIVHQQLRELRQSVLVAPIESPLSLSQTIEPGNQNLHGYQRISHLDF